MQSSIFAILLLSVIYIVYHSGPRKSIAKTAVFV